MQQKYLLDTNAFYNFLKISVPSAQNHDRNTYIDAIRQIKSGKCYISAITQMEIISVIGKYARGVTGGKDKCNCIVSEQGALCENYRYTTSKKPMKQRLVANWLKLIEETMNGTSEIITVSVLPLSQEILNEAQKVVKWALLHRFGALDAVIAATFIHKTESEEFGNMIMITSDKGLKACLEKYHITSWDAFQNKK